MPWFIRWGFCSSNEKNERSQTSVGPQATATFPGWQSWNAGSQKGLFNRSRLVYRMQLSAASRRGLAPTGAAPLLGLSAAPRSCGKYFGRDRHLSLSWIFWFGNSGLLSSPLLEQLTRARGFLITHKCTGALQSPMCLSSDFIFKTMKQILTLLETKMYITVRSRQRT